MSLINSALWKMYMGDTVMPVGCTYEQFCAAREAVWETNSVEQDIEYVNMLSNVDKSKLSDEMKAYAELETTNALERINDVNI